MRKLTPTLVALAMLVGTSVATFAAEGSSAPGATAKGGANPSGAAGTANHSNTGTPSAATNPPPTTGCGTLDQRDEARHTLLIRPWTSLSSSNRHSNSQREADGNE
jgi:hypothetical protein